MEFHALRYGFVSLGRLLSNCPEQMAKGHLFWPYLPPFDWTDELIEVKLEIVNIKTSLAETRLIFFPFVNRAIKEFESQSVSVLRSEEHTSELQSLRHLVC